MNKKLLLPVLIPFGLAVSLSAMADTVAKTTVTHTDGTKSVIVTDGNGTTVQLFDFTGKRVGPSEILGTGYTHEDVVEHQMRDGSMRGKTHLEDGDSSKDIQS